MGRTIAMPSEQELPAGPRRDFVIELRRYYRAAGRPALRAISQEIEHHPDPELREVTASAETIRRMITGKVLPVEQDRVQAVFRVLCRLAKVDPDATRRGPDPWDTGETNWQYIQRLWDAALEDAADAPPFPKPTPPPPQAPFSGRAERGSWTGVPGDRGYSDEPPF